MNDTDVSVLAMLSTKYGLKRVPGSTSLAPNIISLPSGARQRKLRRNSPTASSAMSTPRSPVKCITSCSKSWVR